MTRLPAWASALPLALGGSGLFLVAVIDASFFAVPEINDFLVVLAVVKQPALLWYYALMSAAGSVVGCYLLFAIARKGGRGFLEKRGDSRHLERIRSLVTRYGPPGVFVASLLPPPTPFKLFVMASGVSGMRSSSLILAVAAGRVLRYVAEGLLACWMGERAIDFIRDNSPTAGFYVAMLTIAGALCWLLWRTRSERRRRAA